MHVLESVEGVGVKLDYRQATSLTWLQHSMQDMCHLAAMLEPGTVLDDIEPGDKWQTAQHMELAADIIKKVIATDGVLGVFEKRDAYLLSEAALLRKRAIFFYAKDMTGAVPTIMSKVSEGTFKGVVFEFCCLRRAQCFFLFFLSSFSLLSVLSLFFLHLLSSSSFFIFFSSSSSSFLTFQSKH